MGFVPVTATVTAYVRAEQTIETIKNILRCQPAPDQVLVHVDAGMQDCAAAIRAAFSDIPIIVSSQSVGPGGGRNKLMAAARNELVANFDDDSYPYDLDFFGRALRLFELFPKASVIGAEVIHPHETIPVEQQAISEAASFSGGAVVFRRKDLMTAGGYIPLPIAYGAEEEDISLRLFEAGKTILFSPWLRVFHNNTLDHHKDSAINAHVIATIGMLAFLRYPKRHWIYGLGQVANRIWWCARSGRRRGILRGLALLPVQAMKYRALRAPVSPQAFRAKRLARSSALRNF
jgi:GT2 family glycosyltransferase